MSRLFARHPPRDGADHHPYETLLEPRRADAGAAPVAGGARKWLSADARRRASWAGAGPGKKLVKDPSGSARPSFSVEIADGDGGGPASEDAKGKEANGGKGEKGVMGKLMGFWK